MKRSRVISLSMMAAGGLTLTACDDPPQEARFYPSAEACLAEGTVPEAECRDGFASAQKAHEETAPRFTDLATCEAEFGAGACYRPGSAPTQASGGGGGSFFLPFLAGYAISNVLGGGGYGRSYQPIYRNSGGSLFTGRGTQLSPGGGSVVRAPAREFQSAPPRRTAVVSRGGFGSRSFGGG